MIFPRLYLRKKSNLCKWIAMELVCHYFVGCVIQQPKRCPSGPAKILSPPKQVIQFNGIHSARFSCVSYLSPCYHLSSQNAVVAKVLVFMWFVNSLCMLEWKSSVVSQQLAVPVIIGLLKRSVWFMLYVEWTCKWSHFFSYSHTHLTFGTFCMDWKTIMLDYFLSQNALQY